MKNNQNVLLFGTAGIRGTEGEGFDHMNERTILSIAVGIRDYINSLCQENPEVVIGYDTRLNSKKYEQIFVDVLSSSMIKVYRGKSISSTPLITFGTKYLNATLGIIITSSHNSCEYNGVKVVRSTGILIDDEEAKKIEEFISEARENILKGKVQKRDFYPLKKYIKWHPVGMQNEFFSVGLKIAGNNKKDIKIVYTPLHGTGSAFMPKLFKKAKFKNVYFVEKQMIKDPSFPTCPYPNPEFFNVYDLAVEKAEKVGAEVILANDPDADRMGVAIKTPEGFKLLSGNDVGVILAYNILSKNKIKDSNYIVSTVVSTPFIEDVAKFFNVKLFLELTGFKNIGARIEKEREGFLFGFEESCGYLVTNKSRDKDGISGIMYFAKLAQELRQAGISVYEYLEQIYKNIGYGYVNLEDNFMVDSIKSADKAINKLRKNLPETFAGLKVIKTNDFLKTHKSNFLEFKFKDARVIVRPSGTEPKMKLYASVKFTKDKRKAEEKCKKIIEKAKIFLKNNI